MFLTHTNEQLQFYQTLLFRKSGNKKNPKKHINIIFRYLKIHLAAKHWWLTPAPWEAKLRRIEPDPANSS